MPFGMWTWVGPSNHVLDGDPDPPLEGALLRAKMGQPRTCPGQDMSDGRYTQSDLAGGRTGTVRMPGMY